MCSGLAGSGVIDAMGSEWFAKKLTFTKLDALRGEVISCSQERLCHLSHESQTIRPCFCTRSLRSYLHWPIKQSHLRLEDVGDGEPHELCGFPESSRVAICRILDAERSCRSDPADAQHLPRMPPLRMHPPSHLVERTSEPFESHEENLR